MTVRRFDTAPLHVQDVANDFCPLFYIPAADVISGRKNCLKRDRGIHICRAWRCIPILEPVQCPKAEATCITFHAAAVVRRGSNEAPNWTAHLRPRCDV